MKVEQIRDHFDDALTWRCCCLLLNRLLDLILTISIIEADEVIKANKIRIIFVPFMYPNSRLTIVWIFTPKLSQILGFSFQKKKNIWIPKNDLSIALKYKWLNFVDKQHHVKGGNKGICCEDFFHMPSFFAMMKL